MTSRGPFQPKTFYDSTILFVSFTLYVLNTILIASFQLSAFNTPSEEKSKDRNIP